MVSDEIFRLFTFIDLLLMTFFRVNIALLAQYRTAVPDIRNHVPDIRCRPSALGFFLQCSGRKCCRFPLLPLPASAVRRRDMPSIQLLGDLRKAKSLFCKKPEYHPDDLCLFRDDKYCPTAISILVHRILAFAKFITVDVLVADISCRKPFLVAPCDVGRNRAALFLCNGRQCGEDELTVSA